MTTFTLVLLSTLTVTSYRSVPKQTDSSPFITSTGERVLEGGIASSRDLLCPMVFFKDLRIRKHKADKCFLKERLHYGDTVYIKEYGLFRINDCMHQRHKNRMDVWVKTYKEEKAFGTQRLAVYRLQKKFSWWETIKNFILGE